jgi:hypothetical protein
MKIRILIITALFLLFNPVKAQLSTCKVVMPSISGTYSGGCKRGLAHGKGTAQGIDFYEGQFVKGLPSGKGTYKWKDGPYYEGEWKNGVREGKGKMVYQDSLVTGYWKNDKYIGEELIAPYQITRSMNIARATIIKSGSVDGVRILLLQAGSDNISVENFSLAYSSGSEYRSGRMYGIQNVLFPLDVKLKYLIWNKMRTGKNEVIFEFTINEPGAWEVTLNN